MPFRSLALMLFSGALALLVALLFTPDRGRRAELFGLSVTLLVAGVARVGAKVTRAPTLDARDTLATHSG